MSAKSDLHFSTRSILEKDLRQPNEHLGADVTTLATFSEGFYWRLKIQPAIIWKKFEDVINEIPSVLNRNTNAPTPSVFKRAAAFTIAFIIHSPLDQPFPAKSFPQKLTKITNQNAIVAFEYARQCLHESSYVMVDDVKNPGRKVTLKNKIKVSAHFYYDTIHAISNIKSVESFHFISLFYESLAYKSNRRACYPEVL